MVLRLLHSFVFFPPRIYVHSSVLQTSLQLRKHSLCSLQYPDVNCVNCNMQGSLSIYPYACINMTGCEWLCPELRPCIFLYTNQVSKWRKLFLFFFLLTQQMTWKVVLWKMSTLSALGFVTINKTSVKTRT